MSEVVNMDEQAVGNCYETALELVSYLEGIVPDVALVHGRVHGRGALEGLSFGHAWVEVGDTVIDHSNGSKVSTTKEAYYQLGKITDVTRYSFSEVLEHFASTLHAGPWDRRYWDVLKEGETRST